MCSNQGHRIHYYWNNDCVRLRHAHINFRRSFYEVDRMKNTQTLMAVLAVASSLGMCIEPIWSQTDSGSRSGTDAPSTGASTSLHTPGASGNSTHGSVTNCPDSTTSRPKSSSGTAGNSGTSAGATDRNAAARRSGESGLSQPNTDCGPSTSGTSGSRSGTGSSTGSDRSTTGTVR